jgi:hypothetical protein
MENWIIVCESGTEALVSGDTAADVEETWDADVEAGKAEPRIEGATRRASRGDVSRCVDMGHDYR